MREFTLPRPIRRLDPRPLIRQNPGFAIATVALGVIGFALCLLVIWPAYRDPQGRMYSSGLGYGGMKRALGLAFEVDTAVARTEDVVVPYLGEGVLAGDPLRVPVIPMARIRKLHVEEGERVTKGQLLLELDPAEAERNLASARLQVATAEAELERVKIGSAYVLAQERPEHDKIQLDAALADAALLQEKLEAQRNLFDKGVIGRIQVLEVERSLGEARKFVDEARFFSGISDLGAAYSLRIAGNALEDARQNLAFREAERANYRVEAPADGIVTRVLVREGEFNQDFGKPAFLLTTGKWFEGFFDQSVLAALAEGQAAGIYLEAFPGRPIPAEVERIIPEVTFASGGPEISRPLRPRGTGAPEWSASFRVRFRFVEDDPRFALGMTGSVRVETVLESVVVPRNAVLSIAAGRGLVLRPDPDNDEAFMPRPVQVGHIGGDVIQISDGLRAGEEVLVSGHRILREGDRIRVKR